MKGKCPKFMSLSPKYEIVTKAKCPKFINLIPK
jgi:hypothetical protein